MAEDVVRPVCRCHGVPKAKNGHDAWGQKWQCAVKNRERAKRWFAELDHEQRSTAMLRLYFSKLDRRLRLREPA